MIVLTKNSVNENIALTLNEFATISNPNYLFEFISDTTKDKYYVICQDLSNFKERYNLFNLTEGVNDLQNGSLILGEVGFYRYNVYEQIGNSLDPTDLNKVESGKMKLIGNNQYFTRNKIEKDIIVYEQ